MDLDFGDFPESSMLGDGTREDSIIDPEPPVIPTQVSFPIRTAIRTGVQVLVAAAFAYVLRYVPALGPVLTDETARVVTVELTAVVMAVLSAGVAWVMSRPAVDSLLSKINLSAQPGSMHG